MHEPNYIDEYLKQLCARHRIPKNLSRKLILTIYIYLTTNYEFTYTDIGIINTYDLLQLNVINHF